MPELTKGSKVILMLTVLIACYSNDYVYCSHLVCVDQSECTAHSCLQCPEVDADCQFDNVTNSLHCQPADLAQCNLTECDECQHCQGLLFRRDQEWKLTSFCFSFDDSTCDLGLITDQCIVNENVTDASVIVAQVEGESEFHQVCSCVEENCTQEFVVNYFITPEEQMPSPSETPSPPAIVPTDSNLPTALAVAIAIIGTILIVIIVFVCGGIAFYAHNYLKSTPRRRQNLQIGFQNGLGDQHQPFELLELIGQGHYGSIWRAECDNQEVAVKIFNSQNRGSWENERHLHAMESTVHRNILEFVTSESRGTGYDVVQYYMVTRYYPLGSLSKFLRSHTVSWEQTCRMVRSVASGLTHLHSEDYTNSSGIVAEKYPIAHRDIKSANVLVRSEDGECVLGDLGLALILDPSVDSKQLANSGQVGTFRYMAPEALDARVNLHNLESFKQIDTYAFALVVWEIMWRCKVQDDEEVPSYQPPFEEYVVRKRPSGPSLEDIKDIVATRKLRPTIPPCWRSHQGLTVLVETVQECWDADPEARLSAANVLVRMEDLLQEGGSEARPVGGGETSTHPPDSTNTRNLVADPQQPPYFSPPTNEDPLFEIYKHPDTRPPPYSRLDTHARPGNPNRPYFQTSMPHIVSGGYDSGRSYGCQPPPRPAQSLRNCTLPEGQVIELSDFDNQERLQPGSVRNSLILGTGDNDTVVYHPPPSEASIQNVHETVHRSRSDSHTHTDVMSDSRSSQISNSDSGFQNSNGRHSNTSNTSENSCLLSSFESPVEVPSESSTSTIEAVDTRFGVNIGVSVGSLTGSSITTTV